MEEMMEEHAELQIIQRSIIKISALLAIGFGEAGSSIIKNNLKNNNDNLDPMMKGSIIKAFYGFCDIRDFPFINEALREDCVIFVNRIAEIVHKSVDKFGGATNKNIGDAFLNVWKFPDLSPTKKKYYIEPNNIHAKVVADKAILSFLYIIRALKVNKEIIDYSKDDRISNINPDYKVNMGFGIHYGWAIEGTIGSKYKIDASYLSPNVNIAARLEAATRQYGVTLLISGEVYDFLSDELKNQFREIDRVNVKGSKEALRLFTIELDLSEPTAELIKKSHDKLNGTEKIKKYLEKKLLYKHMFDKVLTNTDLNFRTEFFLKKLSAIFVNRKSSFYEKFEEGFNCYIEGNWVKANKLFDKCLQINSNDGPTLNLKKFINEYKLSPPDNLKGVRELTSK